MQALTVRSIVVLFGIAGTLSIGAVSQRHRVEPADAATRPANKAAAKKAAAEKKAAAAGGGVVSKWSIDDLILAERASSWTMARDGSLAAWVRSGVTKVSGEEKRISNLWLTHLDDGTSVQMTRGTDEVESPRFSPDGDFIAFLSDRKLPPSEEAKPTAADAAAAASSDDDDDNKTQLWVIPTDGGEARPLTRLDRSVTAFGWADDDTIIIAAPESKSLWEQEHKETKDNSVVVEDAKRTPPVRLFKLEVDDGTVTHLTRNTDWIDSLEISPDGKWAAVTAQQSLSYQFDESIRPRLYLVSLDSGEMSSLIDTARDNIVANSIEWAPDSAAFYFVNSHSRDPKYRSASINELHRCEVASKTISKIDLGWERGLGQIGNAVVALKDGFIAMLADGAYNRPARYRRGDQGWAREDLTGTHVRNLDDLACSPDGTHIVYATSKCTAMPQGYMATLKGHEVIGEKQITDLNQGLVGKPTGRVEIIQWKGAKDETVEGILSYPLNWNQGERHPLILIPHGGPASQSLDQWTSSWAEPFILWRQKGAFTLEPNYHGSANYGLDWVESIGNGNYYDLEIPDLQKGVDALIAQGLVDPDKLGVGGWSNGGILTADLITKDHRFKAASIGAADVEWLSDWANVDFGAGFDNYYFGGPPWEKIDTYIKKSPFFRMKDVTTPAIIYTGTNDRNVPPHQSWSTFRALQQIGKTPARLVLFPDEPHGLQKIAHQRRKMEEDMAWFDKYLFAEAPKEIESVKAGTLIAAMLQRGKAKNVNDQYGVMQNNVLVPEVVKFQNMQVGRFEITRAQFAAFDPAQKVVAGEENLPASGITFDQAKNYVKWLAEKTGLKFRLPTEDELKALAEAASESEGSEGNTLDFWAGYSPNHDDALNIQKTLAGSPTARSLLLPVGSFPGASDDDEEIAPNDVVFDLDGNVAEWAINDKGEGVPVGPSADQPADPKDDAVKAGEAYRGIRVVIGEIAATTMTTTTKPAK